MKDRSKQILIGVVIGLLLCVALDTWKLVKYQNAALYWREQAITQGHYDYEGNPVRPVVRGTNAVARPTSSRTN